MLWNVKKKKKHEIPYKEVWCNCHRMLRVYHAVRQLNTTEFDFSPK